MNEVWSATVRSEGEVYYFASLDGDSYIGVSRPAKIEDYPLLEVLIEGDRNFKPMLMGRRWLRQAEQMGDEVTYHHERPE